MVSPKSYPSAKRMHDVVPFYEQSMLPGSIRTKEDLTRVTTALLKSAPSFDAAVAVTRGAIDRSVFPFNDMSVVDPFEGSAKFHEHATYELALIPQDGTIFVPTLISTQASVVDALRELFAYDRNDLCLEGGAKATFRSLANMVRGTAEVGETFTLYQHIIRMAIGTPLYPLLREIQLRVRDVLAIQWADYDICAITRKCVHARDIRSSQERGSFGQLRYILPLRHEEKRGDTVSSI